MPGSEKQNVVREKFTIILTGLTLEFWPHISRGPSTPPESQPQFPSQNLLPLIQITIDTVSLLSQPTLTVNRWPFFLFYYGDRSNEKSVFSFPLCLCCSLSSLLLWRPSLLSCYDDQTSLLLSKPTVFHPFRNFLLKLLLHPLHHQSTQLFPSAFGHAQRWSIYR